MNKELVKVANPYSDEELEFNEKTGRYQLTLAYTKALFDVCPIKSDSVVERRIKDTSRLVYNYIYNHSHTANRNIVEYLLNHTENGRDFLKEVFSIQVESDFTTGINTLGKLPGVNVSTGQVLDREIIRQNQICVEAENEIRLSQNYFAGINLLYIAPYPARIYQFVRDN